MDVLSVLFMPHFYPARMFLAFRVVINSNPKNLSAIILYENPKPTRPEIIQPVGRFRKSLTKNQREILTKVTKIVY